MPIKMHIQHYLKDTSCKTADKKSPCRSRYFKGSCWSFY